MVEIRGFCGLRFDANKTGALDDVLTPPYDVIDEEERTQLAARSVYNMTHLILPESDAAESGYDRAARLFRGWIESGALRPDQTPSLYLLRQRFTGPDGAALERSAFFGLLKLPEQGERFILGHERTFDKPVQDRLALLRAAQANLEPIFVMYSDARNQLRDVLFAPLDTESSLLRATTSDNVVQELWRVPCPPSLAGHFNDQTLYIADGHHRFKTACDYRDACRREAAADTMPQGCDYVMAGFVAFEDPGLKIYAAHRLVPEPLPLDVAAFKEKLTRYFSFRPISPDAIGTALANANPDACVFVLRARQHGTWLLTLNEAKREELVGNDRSRAWQALDVAVLHRGILKQILGLSDDVSLMYEKDAQAVDALLNAGKASLAFMLRPTRPEQVRACAEAFEPMPQKSTYFYPKLPSGAVMYDFHRDC